MGGKGTTVLSAGYFGVDAYLVETEIDIANGLPNFSIIGLGDTAISESRDRIRTALKNSNFELPPKRIIVNLSPAGIKKEGAYFDLPIALGIMVAMGFIKDRNNILNDYLVMGELSLTGEVKEIRGAINAVIFAKQNGYKGVILPSLNYQEAKLIDGVEIIPVSSLSDLADYIIEGKISIPNFEVEEFEKTVKLDFADVRGQSMAKRALEIAAAGKHNVILIGSPGSGKSMLCKRLPTILPPLTQEESIEVTKMHSIAGLLSTKNPIIKIPPFRAPHHTSSPVAIIGGGKKITPGEVSLASGGVLFLDEVGEFPRQVLESLRQPLEDKIVSITRAQYRVVFQTDFMFVCASNPCPCGFAYEQGECNCSPYEIDKYTKKFSGPIMDRIDLHIEIKRVPYDDLISEEKEESSETIRKRVIKAREIQKQRANKCNGNLTSSEIRKYCKISSDDKKYLKMVVEKLGISARGFDKILKVARTIADLEGSKNIEKLHLMEAISYRDK